MKFCILGNHRDLSIAEIQAVTGVNEFASTSGDALLFETDVPCVQLQNRLAGTIKVGSIVGELAVWDKQACADLISMMMQKKDGKISFGISVYDAGDGKQTKELRAESEKIGLEIKKRLKADGHSSRLVTSREKTLSAVVVKTNHLLESGGEFVLIVTPTTIWIGQTEAVQDFSAWSKRDFGRPARDTKSGMLPPKLARMMINLTGVDPHTSTLFDPFCGSGTVLMEAILLGFKDVIGSDISKKAIADTDKNLSWLTTQQKTATKIDLFVSPAQTLSLPEPVDVIVTETYLGPALHGTEHAKFLKKNSDLLSTLYRETFGSLKYLLREGGKVIVAFPVFKSKNDKVEVASKSMLESLGFIIEGRYYYDRPDQKVGREIFVLRRE